MTSTDHRRHTPSRSIEAHQEDKQPRGHDGDSRFSIVEEHELSHLPSSQASPNLDAASDLDRRRRLSLQAIRDIPAVRERFKPPATPMMSSIATFGE